MTAYNIKEATNEQKILALIPCGKESPIQIRDIKFLLGLDERTIKAIINRLITKKKLVICSIRNPKLGKTGYFIPMTKEELVLGRHTLSSQIKAEVERLSVLKEKNLIKTHKVKKEIEV